MLSTIAEVSKDIKEGKALLLAGDEKQLEQLPAGNWIGGTIPYFMAEKGGTVSREEIYCTEVPDNARFETIKEYGSGNIADITKDAASNGFSFIIIPATSDVHIKYASDAPDFENIFVTPVLKNLRRRRPHRRCSFLPRF